jgi:hypothetical protein
MTIANTTIRGKRLAGISNSARERSPASAAM